MIRLAPYRRTARGLKAAILALSACVPSTSLVAQAPIPIHVASEEHLERAVDAVTLGNDRAALHQFDAALSTARQSMDADWSNNFQLRVAATIQSVGPEGELQDIAIRTYEHVLEARPESPIIWNNLAKLYAGSGRVREADSLFLKAVSAGGDYDHVFRLNYAEFALDQGRSDRAVGMYEKLTAEYPDDPRANGGLVQAYLARGDAAGLAAYCWRQIGRGNARMIVDVGMEVLPSITWDGTPDGRPWGWHDEYASIIAAALGRARYNPETFLETEVGKQLRVLAIDSEGLDGLIRLYDPASIAELRSQDFGWWAMRGFGTFEEVRKKSPRDSFRMLARQIGSDYRSAGNRAAADAYYTLAAELTAEEVDPDAVVELAEMRFEIGDTDGLDSVLAAYNHLLFEAKGAAYLLNDNARIYHFQRALGIMYGRLGRWGNDNTVGTANFHLKEAIKAAEENNRSESSEHIVVSPEIINLRAKSLDKMGDASSGLELRLKYAEQYIDSGKTGAAQSVYSGVKNMDNVVQPSSEQESRIRVLDTEIGRTKTPREH